MNKTPIGDMKWTYETGSTALGDTGDYMPYAYITNGEHELYSTKPEDIEDEELQEICDKLNQSDDPLPEDIDKWLN